MTISRDDADYALEILRATVIDKTAVGVDPGYDGCMAARRNVLESTRAYAMIVAQRFMKQRIDLDDAKPSDVVPGPGSTHS